MVLGVAPIMCEHCDLSIDCRRLIPCEDFTPARNSNFNMETIKIKQLGSFARLREDIGQKY